MSYVAVLFDIICSIPFEILLAFNIFFFLRGNFHWHSVRRVWNYIWESCVACTKKWSPTSSLALYLIMLAFYVACRVFLNASFWVFHLPCLVFHLASLSEICCRNLLGIYSDTPRGISSGSLFAFPTLHMDLVFGILPDINYLTWNPPWITFYVAFYLPSCRAFQQDIFKCLLTFCFAFSLAQFQPFYLTFFSALCDGLSRSFYLAHGAASSP
jgi:hypothetical protein